MRKKNRNPNLTGRPMDCTENLIWLILWNAYGQKVSQHCLKCQVCVPVSPYQMAFINFLSLCYLQLTHSFETLTFGSDTYALCPLWYTQRVLWCHKLGILLVLFKLCLSQARFTVWFVTLQLTVHLMGDQYTQWNSWLSYLSWFSLDGTLIENDVSDVSNGFFFWVLAWTCPGCPLSPNVWAEICSRTP